jgi:signal transduction histidine kinase/CheY-like chemotaxis protein
MLAASTALADVPGDKHVLVINSYHQGFPPSDNAVSGIREVLFAQGRDGRLSLEYLDTKRIGLDQAYLDQFARLLEIKYASARPDVIITTDNNALTFMVDRHDRLFAGVPVVFCGVNNFTDAMLQRDPLITGVVEEPDIRATLDLMTRLHPRCDRVLVISDETPTGLENLAQTRLVARDYQGRIDFRYISGPEIRIEEMLDQLRQADEQTLVLLLEFYRDKTGAYFEPLPTARRISQASVRPVYTHADVFVGHGPVGGKVTSGKLGGSKAARMAREILNGTEVGELPIDRRSPTVYMFDAEQLERFDLSPKALPASSILLNHQLSFYQRYKRIVWTVALVVVGLAGAVVVLSVSIAGRRRAERQLRRQRGLLYHVIDHIPHAVWWKDRNGKYLGANREFARQMQLPDAKLVLGKTRKEVSPLTRDRGARLESIEGPLETPAEEITGLELSMGEEADQRVYILGKLSLRDEKGQVIGMVGLSSDVTQRVHLERDLSQSRKMQAIGQLAGGVAHDFNNLLTVIGGNAQLLASADEPPKEWRELAREVEEASARAADLTRQLLTYARRGAMQKRNIDLCKIIDETVALLRRSIEKRIEIHCTTCSEAMVVLGDATQLQSALLNLALNARDAIADKGSITFEIEPETLDKPRIHEESLEGLAPGRYVRIRVRDTGMGMDPETLSRIFDPFFTTKQRGRGTGLGLSVVYGAVKSHGGTITARSSQGSGTQIDIYLPRSSGTPEEGHAAPVTESLPQGQGNILLVDDEKSVAAFASRVLQSLGYAVTYCTNGMDALKLLRRGGPKFHLALIDVIMPSMGGPELTRLAKQHAPDMPVVWISGYNEQAVEDLGQGGSHPPLLAKPFTAEELARTVATHLDARRTPASRE